MREQQAYPEYVGVRDVTTRAFDRMRSEGCMEGQVLSCTTNLRALPSVIRLSRKARVVVGRKSTRNSEH